MKNGESRKATILELLHVKTENKNNTHHILQWLRHYLSKIFASSFTVTGAFYKNVLHRYLQQMRSMQPEFLNNEN